MVGAEGGLEHQMEDDPLLTLPRIAALGASWIPAGSHRPALRSTGPWFKLFYQYPPFGRHPLGRRGPPQPEAVVGVTSGRDLNGGGPTAV